MDFPNQTPSSAPNPPTPGAPAGPTPVPPAGPGQPTPPAEPTPGAPAGQAPTPVGPAPAPGQPTSPGAPAGPTPVPPAGPGQPTPPAGPTPITVDTSGTTPPSGPPMGPSGLSPQPGGSDAPGNDDVYTMPEKFLNETPTKTKGSGKKHKALTIILVLVIFLAIAGIIGGVAYYMLVGLPQDETPQEQQMPVNDQDSVNDALGNTNDEMEANKNDNANKNENENENTNENANENANTNTTTPTAVTPSKDSDKDDITNEEEKLYQTKADKPDTDEDGYNDGEEVLAGYDPVSPGAARLADSELVDEFINTQYGYQLLYPGDWISEEISESNSDEVLFTPSSLDTAGQFVEVLVVSNSTGFTALDWYVDQTKAKASDLETITNFKGDLEGVYSTDGYTAYYADDNFVYAVTYRYGNSTEVHFTSTFKMIAKSFELTGQKKTQGTETTDDTTPSTDEDANANENTNKNVNGDTTDA